VCEIYSRGEKILKRSTLATIQEYKLFFDEVTPNPLIPFYKAVSPEFFEWLDRVSP
jgi:hypothetical protein